ncbi:MAG: single-stranded DNA-binding protein [Clostridiaceae bacterium]|nr:single-stranded DNA-binding protein [Clostridiaceae bacterium]
MPGNAMENNSASLTGKIISKPEFSHEVYGEGFYNITVEVPRLSNTYDYLPVMFSERLLPLEKFEIGKIVAVDGQFRSYNNYSSEGGHKLLLTVFARDIVIMDPSDKVRVTNSIYLNGFICKNPVYRTTPFGREISDILLAVNRAYNKSDYIPCIAWGRNARYASNFEVGDNIKIWGRIQSRKYQKKLSDGTVEDRIAYEVSISKMEINKHNNNKSDKE